MNILIVGGGRLGRNLAEELDRLGHDVTIIDESEDRLSLLSPAFDGLTFTGFPMDIKSLKLAGIEGCDAMAVTTDDDNLNISVGQIAQNLFKVDNVVARVSDPYREHVFENFGLQTICPTSMASETILSALISPYQSQMITFHTTTVAFESRRLHKKQIGQTLANVKIPSDESILGVIRSDGIFLLKTETLDYVLANGDSIVYSKKID